MLRQRRFENRRTPETNKHTLGPQWFDFISWNYISVKRKKTKRATDALYPTSSPWKFIDYSELRDAKTKNDYHFRLLDSLSQWMWIVCTNASADDLFKVANCLRSQNHKRLTFVMAKRHKRRFIKGKRKKEVLYYSFLAHRHTTSITWRPWFL